MSADRNDGFEHAASAAAIAAAAAASAATTDDFHAYKRVKEDFVSNLSGTTPFEVSLVISVLSANLCVLYAARHVLLPLRHDGNALTSLAVEFACLIVPCLLCITVLSDFIAEYIAVAVAAACVAKVAGSTWCRRRDDARQADALACASVLENLGSSRKWFVSEFKAGVMVLTCIAILAVDFRVFPRRFAKTEVFGTSLMDIGVGSCVFAMGLTSPLSQRWRSASPLPANAREDAPRRSRPLLSWTVVAVVAIGTVRMLVTKGIEYQEHVTE
jgi:phosphatidylinositol glycan class W